MNSLNYKLTLEHDHSLLFLRVIKLIKIEVDDKETNYCNFHN